MRLTVGGNHLSRPAPPLTCLPASSPRIGTGRGAPSSTISPISCVAE